MTAARDLAEQSPELPGDDAAVDPRSSSMPRRRSLIRRRSSPNQPHQPPKSLG
jgi:hypothetical protein